MTMSDKPKQSKASVDYRLEKAFNFTLDDMSANRAGFISQAQAWDMPRWAKTSVWSNRMMQSLLPKRSPQQVIHNCGKITVENQLREVHGGRFQMNAHIVSMPSANLRFSVTQGQAQVLSDGSTYHLYYRADTMQILSIERVTQGCQ